MVPSTRSSPTETSAASRRVDQVFLEFGRCPIHGLTPIMPRFNPPKSPGAAIYHKIPGFSY